MKQLLIEGHIGNDAIIKESNGKQFLAFSVAVNENYKNKEGVDVESIDWISCTSKNLNLAKLLKKGNRVMVQGKPKLKVFQDKERQTKAGLDLLAFNVTVLNYKKQEDPFLSALTNFLNQYKTTAQA